MNAETLKQLPYWGELTETEKQQVAQSAYIRYYAPGERLFGPDVECVGMIHLLSGASRAYLLSDEGREVTLFRLEEDDDCIISAASVLAQINFESYMVVEQPASILIVPVKLFGDLCENNIHVRCFTYELATRRFSQVVAAIEQTLFSRLDKRLAKYLLETYEKTGIRDIRMTQEELARQVNSVRETVGRMLKRFAGEGLIENRRGTVVLKDLEKLEKTAKK
ncbi:Crp/Fnr family transcriptional regulator [Aristaeella hokkaidonensis]|uniref:Crp/Fnr family transcriptional regulator n=1 Tax=Aristaeella hokkaidonensis TaxID=3046382 RepID=A0AC61MVA3_9FIRM|nr:Crp/Fnr family transcriptional regulator [Aristaeella hokkaidonensis]QUC66425.1 Crp/Fnr family transcriptional regulator [Aristaeella hokkaidonensis]SNT94162.1 CRP/FNR family transcriptional regulator, anaerobic regulatory protein [Aristaeella hokkaidonensis]